MHDQILHQVKAPPARDPLKAVPPTQNAGSKAGMAALKGRSTVVVEQGTPLSTAMQNHSSVN
jgi:hypothetical protein